MDADQHTRPDPDALLRSLQAREEQTRKAKLTIFLGMAAGVGKTYDMLRTARELKQQGTDVVVGYVETHGRRDTEAMLGELEVVPRIVREHGGARLEEMDLDTLLTRKPALALVDELAHTNAPGSRHAKRYQDVLELLEHGISVFTTLNIQHLESRADTVAQISGIRVWETVPDSIVDTADEVELVDLSPDDLLKRLAEGKVYTAQQSSMAVKHFFRKGNLTALREMALRLTAERVDRQLRDYMQHEQISGPWKSRGRLVVGISASPHSMKLLRLTRRMAYTMDATWVAVAVETSRVLTEQERVQLARNIKLARELGAEVVSTSDEDVVHALLRVARQEHATQVFIGKPRSIHPFRLSLLERLIKESGELDIFVVGENLGEAKPRRRFQLPRSMSGWPSYLIAAATVLAVAGVCFPFAATLGYQTVSLILLFVLILLPLRLGVGPVLLAALMSALLWDFLFIPPRYTFAVGLLQDVLMLVSFFMVAAVSGTLTVRVRAREQAVRQREERTTALFNLTRDLSRAVSQDGVAKAAIENLRRSFGAEVLLFLSQADGDIFTGAHPASTLPLSPKELNVAAWVYWNEKKAGLHTDTLPSGEATYLPLSGPRYPLGVVGIRLPGGQRMSLDQEILLENFATQIASALERESLNELAKQAIGVEESERLYHTLFNSISHEMRTPVSAILGTSDALLHDTSVTVPAWRDHLEEMHTAAARLNRLVENLLDMTRLESGLIRPRRDWCDLHDLLHAAVKRLTGDLGTRTITVTVPDSTPLVRLDFGLMEQAITNLLHNAVTYTPDGTAIRVLASVEGKACTIEVRDNGPGIPPGEEQRVFQKFYRLPGSKAGGTGLGLSIVRGFVEAHGGTITAARNSEGGASFLIHLPADEQKELDA